MKARIIIPVWGEKYLKRFNAACLPALLAPGNLPHLDKYFDCELVIVTQSSDFESVRSLSSVIQAQQFATLRLVSIDDKLSHPAYYGLTITHALFRGFTDLGEGAKDIWCLFLCADFILADGSYRSLVKKMLSGERCIFSPSYCVIEEEVRPILKEKYLKDGVLAVPPRDMAGLILDHKHFTIRAKIINWQMYQIDRVDQFYYLLDNDTLVGRQLPIAIVAFRPEMVPLDPVTFWDYGVVSEICPTSPLCVLGDSDDFLMLEFRGKETMQGQLKLGWMNPKEIARDLSVWTTKDQRGCGEFDLVVHRTDLPNNIEEAKKNLDDYYRHVFQYVSPTPRSHLNHYIWSGVESLHVQWLENQALLKSNPQLGEKAHAAEVAKTPFSTLFISLLVAMGQIPFKKHGTGTWQHLFDLMRDVYGKVFGRAPDLMPLHPRFSDSLAIKAILDQMQKDKTNMRVLSVWTVVNTTFAPFLGQWFQSVKNATPFEIMSEEGYLELKEGAPYDFCYMELSIKELTQFQSLHMRLRALMKQNGKFLVYCQLPVGEYLRERDFDLIANGMPSSDLAILEMHGSWFSFQAKRAWEAAIKKTQTGKAVDLIQLPFIGLGVVLFGYGAKIKSEKNKELGMYNNRCTSLLLTVQMI